MKYYTWFAPVLIITIVFSLFQPALIVFAQKSDQTGTEASAPVPPKVSEADPVVPDAPVLKIPAPLIPATPGNSGNSGGGNTNGAGIGDTGVGKTDLEDVSGDVTLDPRISEDGPRTFNVTEPVYRDNSRDIVRSQHIEPDSFTGSLRYEYPIVVPPGRNGLTPDLKIVYSSQPSEQTGIYGYGWSDNIPYIERINRTGSEKLYTDHVFYSSFDGELLANDPSPTTESYGAKVENGDFRSYRYADNNKWIVTDKAGTVYTFGTSTLSRQDDPQNSNHIFKWMLEDVRDTNGNFITYEYYKDAGQIYPAKITYTGHDTTAGIFEVVFSRETRPDVRTSFRTGFAATSTSRINEIQTKVNGAWVRKYELDYTTSTSGYRSLLASITESGQDESSNVTTLPTTTFGYQTDNTPSWGQYSSVIPEPVTSIAYADYGSRFFDVNGDGLTDQAVGRGSYNKTYINGPSGLVFDNVWHPATFINIPSNRQTGVGVVDVNGDGLTDVVFHPYATSISDYNYTNINNGHGYDTNPTWTTPYSAYTLFDPGVANQEHGVRYVDVNADGLVDILLARIDGTSTTTTAWINNGAGWTQNSMWASPVPFVNYNNSDYGVRFADVNGDRLVDVLHGTQAGCSNGVSVNKVYINNGRGWTLDTSWSLPTSFAISCDDIGRDNGVRIVDVNGDDLPDLMRALGEGRGAYINNGAGWDSKLEWWTGISPYFMFTDSAFHRDQAMRVADINGDGMDDMLYALDAVSGATSALFKNETKRTDLLVTVISSTGSVATITYQASALYATSTSAYANPQLPQNYDTVKKIEVNDGLGNLTTTNYFYEGGKYYYNNSYDRRPAGFHIVTKTDSASTTEKTYFHQGDTSDTSLGEYSDDAYKIGKPYRTEVRDSSGSLYAATVNKWETQALQNGRGFVKLTQKTDLTYDGDSSHKDKAETYTYATTTGNIIQKVNWGEVTAAADGSFTDTGTDDYKTIVTYAATSTASSSVVGMPASETLKDHNDQKIAETKHYYDSLSYGFVDKGNETKNVRWKTGSEYVSSQKTYNSFGLVTTDIDPRNKETTYSYDSYNLYPTTITNPLTQHTYSVYDYSLGKPKQITDPNGLVFQTVYDGLDRVLEEKQPDLTSSSTLVTKTSYVYTDTGVPRTVKKSDYLDATNIVDTYTYIDGLDRPVQERKEAEDTNTFAVRDFTYNNRGILATESLPYFGTGSARTSATTISALFSTYSYDALKRPQNISNAVGNTTTAYSDWRTTITDPRGKVKDLYTDAQGNLTRVDEHNATSTYSTFYEYNGLQNLTKITDALGNVRNFTYDALGRRTSAEDLHAVGDATFGAYSFVYDDSGNLTEKTDPKNQVTDYTYDDVNRVTAENYTGASGTEISYLYDSCTYGVGRLCTASTTPGTSGASTVVTSYAYNPLGNVTNEHVKIGTAEYDTSYTHNRQGNVVKIVYPDDAEVLYSRNNGGAIDAITRKEGSDLTASSVVSDIDYAPTGQISEIHFANGVTTTNTYDAAALYRMTEKTSVATSSSAYLQKNAYTYDANGNILTIVDTSNTPTAKTLTLTYDDLNRLLTASTTNATTTPGFQQTFGYNAIGNMTQSPLGTYAYGGSVGVNYANPHAPTAIGTLIGMTYDKNGNLLSDGSSIHTWNYRNELVSSRQSSATTTYAYNHTGDRVMLKEDAYPRYFPNRYYDTAGPQATSTKHIFADDLLIATVDTAPTQIIFGGGGGGGGENMMGGGDEGGGGSQTSSFGEIGGLETPPAPTIHYVHTDHLTGSNVVTNETATIDEVADYYPYGKARLDQKTGGYAGEKRKFAGTEYDSTTDLNYMGARYYNGNRGQFMGQDPAFLKIGAPEFEKDYKRKLKQHLVNPQALNSYAYALNNPIKHIDPQGEIVPLVVLGYAGIQLALSSWDAYSTFQVINDPSSSNFAKISSLGLTAVGLIDPVGGGYGGVSKAASNILRNSENLGGHAIRNHVGKSIGELIERLVGEPGLRYSTSYFSESVGDAATYSVLQVRAGDISNWLKNAQNGAKMDFSAELVEGVGHGVDRANNYFNNISKATVVLQKDSSAAAGHRIITSFPNIRK